MSPATISVSNTKLASSLIALGFAFKAELVQPDRRGAELHTQFLFIGQSQRPEYRAINLACAGQWERGELEKAEPMHPLAIMMRAHENRDRLMDWQKQGISHGLRSVAGSQMLIYRRAPVRDFDVEHLPLTDMDLAACIGGVGIPVTAIEGGEGSHRYILPRFGYARKRADASLLLEDAAQLTTLAPTPQDPRRLQLEDSDPTHPVVMMYDALNCRAILKRELNRTTPLLLMQEEGTTRQALITMNSASRVMQRVEKHFKAPPIKWT